MIAPTPWPSPIVPLTGAESVSAYVSLTSSSRSPLTVTVTLLVVSPGVKVRSPLRAA